MLSILFDDGQDAGCDNTMSSAEIVVYFCSETLLPYYAWTCVESDTLESQCNGLFELLQFLGQGEISRSGNALA